jgi:hypothetical protein
MSISHTDVGDNLRKIVILGGLDLASTKSVADELEKLAAAPKKRCSDWMSYRRDGGRNHVVFGARWPQR